MVDEEQLNDSLGSVGLISPDKEGLARLLVGMNESACGGGGAFFCIFNLSNRHIHKPSQSHLQTIQSKEIA